ncbi:hypothetical protein F5Y08DRAFT_344302 [Xylaria arbuscula]|nr:hypothetical protein F5Y08DRAFT_344302 [Xylaria arbuscula]
MRRITEEKPSRTSGLARIWKGHPCTMLGSIFSSKLFREPTLPLKVALAFALLMPLAYSWHLLGVLDIKSQALNFANSASKIQSSIDSDSNSTSDANSNYTQSHVTDGLRMVVFGGGDIATPALSASQWSDQAYSWSEIMCRKLRCDTYISFVPQTDGMGGPVVSNAFLDAAYRRVCPRTVPSDKDGETMKLDYCWATEQYPKFHQQDLVAQVNSFLSSSRSQRATTETLWVFNVGYWDIWYLTALPRKLATEVIDSSIRDLFFQIERLYRRMHDQGIAASRDSRLEYRANRVTRPPFRIFLTRLFDISLTPGFTSARPSPPQPHSSTSQLRNAAFLTKYWNSLLDVALNDWLATSDPDYWSATDRIDIKVIEALAGKRPLADVGRGSGEKKEQGPLGWESEEGLGDEALLPRRRLASYGMSSYLRGLMVDRQLRNAQLFDHNGLGARPPEDGFLEISMPCVLKVTGDQVTKEGDIVSIKEKIVVCQNPDNYLFYTEFTVSPRAIYEIGVRAARSFLNQVEDSSAWEPKAMRRGKSEREGYSNETTLLAV